MHPNQPRQQDGGEGDDADIELAPAVAQHFDDGIADEAEGDAVGDGVGERDGKEGDGDGGGFGDVVPVNLAHGVHHQHRHIQNRASGGIMLYLG